MIELKGLEINYYIHDEKCQQMDDLGMHRPLEEHDMGRATIYGVTSIAETNKCTFIQCGHAEYECPESYESLRDRIERNKVNLF